jgi:hypothetical protein
MRLPNAGDARIPESKLRNYLLDPNGNSPSKARLFAALGYTQANWELLAHDLREQHLVLDAQEGRPSPYGKVYEIVGELRGPKGRARIMSVWMIETGTDVPRFLTAHPS